MISFAANAFNHALWKAFHKAWTTALISASLMGTGSTRFFSTRFVLVTFAFVVFSIFIFSRTLFVALISELPAYFAILMDIPFSSASK